MITQTDLQGHWRRDWIKAPGFSDSTTRVHWLQARGLFADLRVPLERPDLNGRSCLAALTQPELAQLMTAEGFAGHITVDDNCCIWHREINWHGAPEAHDIGRMTFDAGALIEDGVLAEYRELWQHEPETGLRGHRVSCAGQVGVLIENDDIFLIGLGPEPTGSSATLIADLQNNVARQDSIRQHFEAVYCLGHWNGSEGIAQLSTNPFDEGEAVLRRTVDGFQLQTLGFGGDRNRHPLILDAALGAKR